MKEKKIRVRHPEDIALCKALGEKLLQLRKYYKSQDKKKWTLAYIASEIGVEVAAYQKMEKGNTWPRPHHMVGLIRLYGHSFEALLKIKRVHFQEEDDNPGGIQRHG